MNEIKGLGRLTPGDHIILLGCAGAGKGTLSQFLCSTGNYFHLSLGDLFRQIAREKPHGKIARSINTGQIVSPTKSFKIFEKHFAIAQRNHQSVIIDGMVLNQVFLDYLDRFFKEQSLENNVAYVHLSITEKEAKKRLTERVTCPTCNRVYVHLNKCTVNTCGAELIKRTDDSNLETVQRRIDRFFKGTPASSSVYSLIEQYRGRKNYREIDARLPLLTLEKQYRHIFSLPYQFIGIGYPVIDRIISTSQTSFASFNLAKGTGNVVDWTTFSKLSLTESSAKRGGSTANTMVALAWLNEKTRFVGKIGPDEEGKTFNTALKTLNVTSCLLESPSATPTTQVACLVTPDGERTMLIFLGAGAELTEKDLVPAQFAQAELFHLDGYSLWNGQLFTSAIAMAKENNALVSFDLGSPFIAQSNKETITSMLPKIDFIFGNEEEIEALTGQGLDEGVQMLAEQYPHLIIVAKRGEQGCIVAHGKTMIATNGVLVSKVVDTIGAGDNFASGFLYRFMHGFSLAECAQFANQMGAAAVESEGGEISASKREALIALSLS